MTEGYYYVRDWYKKVHYGSRLAPWIKFDQSFFVDAVSLSPQDQVWLMKVYLAAIPLDGRLPLECRLISRLIGLARHDLTASLLARLEDRLLISKEDVRGARLHPASKVIQTTKPKAIEEKPKPNGFIKPDLATVEAYMTEKGFSDPARTARKFMAHYESNGWKVGKAKMVSWKSAVSGAWKENETPKLDWGSV